MMFTCKCGKAFRNLKMETTETTNNNLLSEVTWTTIGGVDAEYVYDPAGNRTNTVWDNAATVYAANGLNQYWTITSGGVTDGYTYNPWGALTGTRSFSYGYYDNLLCGVYTNRTQGQSRVCGYEYDALKRRRTKDSTPRNAPHRYHYYVYSGWSLQVEDIFTGTDYWNPSETTYYVWGKDLSGTLDGAGGVGGLLATEVGGVWYFPLYDNNGNVTDYVSETGEVVASYTYDAFGRTIAKSGVMADTFPFRFSTKYYDAESGLYYYGYRYYSPELGRWLTRDPIEEEGGDNLYAFCDNCPILLCDVLGLDELDDIEAMYRQIIAKARERGADVAADNLEYFLSTQGGSRTLPVTWLRGFTPVIQGESTNKTRFEVKLKEKAKNLPNGSQMTFNDYWDASRTGDTLTELYYASGTFTITSYGTFRLSREGCNVSISGYVDHYWWDPYDWHTGWKVKIPGFGFVNDSDAIKLQKAGRAAPFFMESEWNQGFATTYNLRKDSWQPGWGSVSVGTSGARETVIAEFGDVARRPKPSTNSPPPPTTAPSPNPKQRWGLR